MARLVAALSIVWLLNSGIAGAQTTTEVAAVADALRQDPVYVDDGAERAITADEANELREAIRESGQPIFVAVLPESVAPTSAQAGQLPGALALETGLSGTYAVVVGERFRATSTSLSNADELATAAFQDSADEGAAAVLQGFVARVATGAGGGAAPGGAAGSPDDGESSGGGTSWLPIVLLAGVGGGLLLWYQRRRRRDAAAAAAELAADRQMLQAELSVLADDVLRLEPQVALHPDARADYDAGVSRYRAAQAALEYADEPVDLERVTRVIVEARYAMERARAGIEGRPPPAPPEELRQPGRRGEPPLETDEYGRPQYVGAGAPFYGGGWFGGGGGLFTGLLLGSMLGGGWGWGGGHDVYIDNTVEGGGDGGGWGGFDSGDVGGGDWGGDVGGGDW